MNKFDFSFLTYSELPNLDPDDLLLKNELEQRGYKTQAVVWNDKSVDWSNAGLCVVRSTWDYHKNHSEFLACINKISACTQIFNDAQTISWNSCKTYLRDLANKGVSIVPTVFIEKADGKTLKQIAQETGWNDLIIKPVTGLATYGVKRCVSSDQESLTLGEKHLQSLLSSGIAMVQPFIASVNDYGERSLVFFGGQYSHSVRKSAFQHLAVAGEAGETRAEDCPDEIEFAASVLSVLDKTPAYSRVDLIRNSENKLCLMELELIEPSLFLGFHPASVSNFADFLVKIAVKKAGISGA